MPHSLTAKGISQPQSGSAVFRYSRKFGGAPSAEISVIHYQKTLAYTIPSIESVLSFEHPSRGILAALETS